MRDASPLVTAVLDGWRLDNDRLISVLRPLTDAQLQLRPSPDHWAIWQLASNMAGGRVFWLHDILGEGDDELRNMFRVTAPTVPVPIEDAGWEDDEAHPRSAIELSGGLARTWQLVEECVNRWSADDLAVVFTRPGGSVPTFTRAWVVWHIVEHDLQHGAEIALILRANGLPTFQL